jgi:hypothetical protein
MDFHFPHRLCWEFEKGQKGILEIIINLLPMKYESLDKLQMDFSSF